jgi:hypothetical protein
MWALEITTQFEKDQKHYSKKRPNELSATLNNLQRLLSILNTGKKPGTFQAGFIHEEPGGVLAVDQKGGGKNLQETRLYTFPDSETETLHLITIGNKKNQSNDIQLAKHFAQSLKTHSQQNTK